MGPIQSYGSNDTDLTANADVGVLYNLVNNGGVDAEGLKKVLMAGIELGHAGVLTHAATRLNYVIPKRVAAYALDKALGVRGWDIANPNCSVGSLYQFLFGSDFETFSIQIVTENETGTKQTQTIPYSLFDPIEKRCAQFLALESKGFDVRERLGNFRRQMRTRGIRTPYDYILITAIDNFFQHSSKSSQEEVPN